MLLLDSSAGGFVPRAPRVVGGPRSHDASAAPVAVGEVLGGKYRVERFLGFGGMGFVVAATHLALERLVALKIMRPELCDDDAANTRFLREARAAARLSGDHVARVIDVGTIASNDRASRVDVPCIVMEYLEGEDLSAHLAHRACVPVHEVAELMLQACQALDEAHAASIIHRDLKPANLFLSRRSDGSRCVKVLDFGISKDSRAELRVTKASDTIGSPLYVAPEQLISAHDVDARADIWALGVIMYELVSGRSPFFGRNATTICASVLQARYQPLSDLCVDLPDGFEDVVVRCLQREPEHRFASAAELAAALSGFVGQRERTLRWWLRPAASSPGGMHPSSAPAPASSQRALPLPPVSQRALPPVSQRGFPAPSQRGFPAPSQRGLGAVPLRALPPSVASPAPSRTNWGVWIPCAALLGMSLALFSAERLTGWQLPRPGGGHRPPLARLFTPQVQDTASLLHPETLAPPRPSASMRPSLPAASVVTLDELPDLAETKARTGRPAPRPKKTR